MEPSLLDKDFRLSSLYKIVDQTANLVRFQLNKAQQHFHKHKAKRNIILKSRRLGFTTYSAIDMLDNTLFNPNFNALFISYDEASSTEVFDKLIDFNWKHLPKEITSLYEIDASNAKTLKLNFGDNTFSQIMVKTSGRGSGLNHIHISELGPIAEKTPPKAKEIMSGTIPSLTPDGFLTIESTAQGEDNMFHKLFTEAWTNPRAYETNPKALKPFFYNWQWDEQILRIQNPDPNLPKDFLDYQKKHNELAKSNPLLYRPITDIQLTYWYQKYIESGSDWSILKENFPTTPEEAFTTSGLKVFTQESVIHQLPYIINPIDRQGEWTFYKHPNPRHSYVLGVDPAEGVGRDHSAIVILDISTTKAEVVATFTSDTIDPDLLAYEVKHKATLYNTAFVTVERNNTGHGTLTRLKGLYPVDKIYTERKEEFEETKQTDKLGFVSTGKSKQDIFMNLKALLDQTHIKIHSNPLLSEIKMYGRKHLQTTKSTEEMTNHFDLLTALSLAAHGMKFALDDSQDIITTTPKSTKKFNPFALMG
jgi:hypothetical protein